MSRNALMSSMLVRPIFSRASFMAAHSSPNDASKLGL